MSLRSDLQHKDFVITAEINPMKSADFSEALSNAKKVKDLVSGLNITDNSGAGMKMCPLVLSHLIQQLGIEAIWQITCRDRNRLALQSDLLGAWALGLKNILALRGDPPIKDGALKEEKCFDLNTEELILAINKMRQGKDLEGLDFKPMNNLPDFCVGSAAHPCAPDLKAQKETMLRRMDTGVEFFQTQICFEIDKIDQFVDSIGEELARKTLLGITPLKSLKQAEFMNKNIWGVTVPQDHLGALQKSIGGNDPNSEAAKKAEQETGLKLNAKLVEHISKTPLRGIHLMAIGQESLLSEIIKNLPSINYQN